MKRLVTPWLLIRRHPSKSAIFLLIISTHFYLLTFFIQYTKPIVSKLTQPIEVRTIVQHRVMVNEQKKDLISKKKEAPKRAIKQSNKRPQLLQNLTQKRSDLKPIKSIEIKPLPTIPEKIRHLNIDIQEESVNPEETGSYLTSLVSYLKQSLLLPEFGSVKIQLTIMEDGRVKELKVLSSEAESNKFYLETELPLLIFPKNKKKLLNKITETFIFTFCND